MPEASQPPQKLDDSSVQFVLRLVRALHDQGTPAHRLEDLMTALFARLELTGEVYSTPTAIIASFATARGPSTYLLRVGGGRVDLGRTADLDAVALAVERGELTPEAASKRVDAIIDAPPRYGRWLTLGCYGINSAAASRFFGGGLMEALAALAIGLAIGLLAGASPRRWRAFEPVAAFVVSALAMVIAWMVPISAAVAILAGLIVLLPGYALTVAMVELSTRHLQSGSARLVGAGMTFLTIAFGVALGTRAGDLLPGAMALVKPVALPGWTEAVALLASGLTFGVIFRAQPRDLGWIMLASALAYLGSRGGALVLGPELGAFAGALLLAVGANVYARALQRPAAIPLIPAIMLLVPGTIGFRSITELMASDVLNGVQTAFSAIVVGVAIATGLLLANEVVSPRRPL